jgi:asparagine synthase (glutamine-hydrolysing)
MCGIVGVWARDGAQLDVEQVVALRDRLAHRGPDDSGAWRAPGGDLVLAHRRLAIVDLTPAGRQPLANEDGSVWVTFNGEIYNHAALRKELERRGHRFRSRCDTEVLVHLYEEEGDELVRRLVGMFAFALWDERRGRLLLARDRVGIKPLYWLDDGRRFGFASEAKALLPLLSRREVDPAALVQYLTFSAVPPPRTLFAGVSKLAPGALMVVERDGPRPPRRWWDPIADRAQLEGEGVDWAGELRDRLERSVQRRMMSDVPVGVFLSGGVDSSTNVALMSRVTDEPLRTFNVTYRETSDYDESAWARTVAARFGAEHREVSIDAEALWDLWPTLVFHQDEPIGDPVCVPLYFVARLAKESGVTVVHVGEGADELLAGYPTYVRAYAAATRYWPRLRALPTPARRGLAAAGSVALRNRPRLEIHREALLRAAAADARLWWGGAVAFYPQALGRVTTARLRTAVDGAAPDALVGAVAADADRHGARDELDRLIYQDLRVRLPELLLMRVDKLTMAHAVEARVPFLDHELVELAMAMPPGEKISDGVGKHVLKRAMGDLLPADLLWRPKQGFGAPVRRWFAGELAERVERRLRRSAVHELGYLQWAGMRRLLDDHRRGRADRSFQIWNLLNLAVWFDFWVAGDLEAGRP